MTTKTDRADVLDQLRAIVKQHQYQHVTMGDGPPIRVDATTANAMVTVFDALKSDANRDKWRKLARTRAGFMRLVDFTWNAIG